MLIFWQRGRAVVLFDPPSNSFLVTCLYEYMLRIDSVLEDDLARSRKLESDNMDLVCWLECNVRLQTAREIFRDISWIIRISGSRSPPS